MRPWSALVIAGAARKSMSAMPMPTSTLSLPKMRFWPSNFVQSVPIRLYDRVEVVAAARRRGSRRQRRPSRPDLTRADRRAGQGGQPGAAKECPTVETTVL